MKIAIVVADLEYTINIELIIISTKNSEFFIVCPQSN